MRDHRLQHGAQACTHVTNVVTGIVTDSLGRGIGGISVSAFILSNGDTVATGNAEKGSTLAAGEYEISWLSPVPPEYDSLTIHTSAGSSTTSVCSPYSFVQVTRTAAQLAEFPNDSVHIPLSLGLDSAPPTLSPGTSCAIGWNPFGDWTSSFLFELTIESLGVEPGDSIRGQWHIAFTETRSNLQGSFAGSVAGDTLELALAVAPDNYVECAPGYQLRIALVEDQHLGDGFLETLNPTVPACPVDQLYPLRFVPSGDVIPS